jgi:hypothetical protein
VPAIVSSALSSSTSSNTTTGALPPSSRCTRFSVVAALAAIRLPVSTEPVSETMSTSGWSTSACPAGSPWPQTTLRTPAGRNSAASSARRSAVIGVVSAGLSTIVLPVASAGPIFQIAINSG